MTNTSTAQIAEARWVTTTRNPQSDYDSISELLRVDAGPSEVEELFYELTRVRGAHRVEIKRRFPDYVEGRRVESPWFGLFVRGTSRALATAAEMIVESGLANADKDADHDHAACVSRAREMGVPERWAHMPETYLSM